MTRRSAVADDVRSVGWWVLVGVGSGAIAGAVVGGCGGRLAMLLLRLTSPDLVVGMTSDDGFEIGVVTLDTLQLVLAMAVLGGVNGVLYAALRGAIPPRARLPLWSLFAAALGGVNIVHEDGVDFTLLGPAVLAIGLFVLLPGAAAALVVVLVERWCAVEPWSKPGLTGILAGAALMGTFALGVALLVGACALVLRWVRVDRAVARVSRVAVPVALGLVAVVAGWALVAESIRIVD